ncbi:protein THEMIS3-like [Acomys russatus]|uniref:protein THEMIS3-like n=1 Tax=Acomys russatus TaxID=60746 RepID=UPI0021E32484|nr:protein THEMIS3-like [Acomys russatus]
MEKSWNSYINSLNQNSLPRQVEVTDGNYFSGSLDNLSFSKGDIITVVDLEPIGVRAEVKAGEQALGVVNIPLGYKGYFQLIADPVPFETVADLVHSVRLPKSPMTHRGPPHFQNLVPVSTDDDPPMKLRKGETLSLIGLDESQGRRLLRCEVLRGKSPLRLLLPVDCRGLFQECLDDQLYSIDTILRWKLLTGRKRRVRVEAGHRLSRLSLLVPEHFSGHLVLHPCFSVMAHLPGEHQISIPSDLDIHITEMTSLDCKPFAVTTMRQIYSMEKSKFPVRIKIMSVVLSENSAHPKPLKCGQLLTILRTEEVKKFIATEISRGKKGRYFLIPYNYRGLVLRRGCYFYAVSDVAAAMHHGQLCFWSSRDYTSFLEPLASFTANECFLALKKSVVSVEIHRELHRVEVLKCLNIATKAHVKLPLFAEGEFIELFDDAGPGTLQELCQVPRLPCHIRVVSPDPSMTRDPLYGTEELRIENIIVEQCLIAKEEASLEDMTSAEDIYRDWPEATFEIPIEKSSCEVLVVEERSWVADVRKESRTSLQSVQETTEESLALSHCLISPRPPPPVPKPRSLLQVVSVCCRCDQMPEMINSWGKKEKHTEPRPCQGAWATAKATFTPESPVGQSPGRLLPPHPQHLEVWTVTTGYALRPLFLGRAANKSAWFLGTVRGDSKPRVETRKAERAEGTG